MTVWLVLYYLFETFQQKIPYQNKLIRNLDFTLADDKFNKIKSFMIW